MKIGAQLYTVRDYTQTEIDFAKTIKRIATIGYKQVQISAIGPIPAQTITNKSIEKLDKPIIQLNNVKNRGKQQWGII